MNWDMIGDAAGYVISAIAGGLLLKIASGWLFLRKGNAEINRDQRKSDYEIDKAKRDDILAEFRESLERSSKDNDRLRSENQRLRDESETRERDCQDDKSELGKALARAEERILTYEDMLSNAGIKYRPYIKSQDSSSPHHPLPEKTKE